MKHSPPQKTKQKNHQLLASLAILCATAIWGLGFNFQKLALILGISSFALPFMRFALATAFIGLLFFKTIRREYRPGQWKSGLVIGGLLCAGSIIQSVGLATTTPGNSAFITSTYVVMVPLLWWALTRQRLSPMVAVSCVLSFIGLVILSVDFSQGFHVSTGDLITLLSAFIFALHIVAVGKMAQSVNHIVLSFLQFLGATLFGFIAFAATGFDTTGLGEMKGIISVLYLGIFSTGVAITLQTVGQTHLSSSKAGIFLSTESLFGTLFSVIIGYDQLSFQIIAGGLAMFLAIVLPEIWLFFRQKASASR